MNAPPTTGTPCPLCQTPVYLRFPADFPPEEVIATRYAHAVMERAGGVKNTAGKVLKLSFRALNRRLDRELKAVKPPANADDRARDAVAAVNAVALKPVGPAGVCSGTWSKIGSGAEAAAYDLRFNDGVKGIMPSTDCPAGKRPTIVVGEEDGTERTFEFGEPCQSESIAFTVPVRAGHSLVAVVNVEVGET